MTSPVGQDRPGGQNAMDDLDARIRRIAEAIDRHIAREDMARRSKGQNEIVPLETDLNDCEGWPGFPPIWARHCVRGIATEKQRNATHGQIERLRSSSDPFASHVLCESECA